MKRFSWNKIETRCNNIDVFQINHDIFITYFPIHHRHHRPWQGRKLIVPERARTHNLKSRQVLHGRTLDPGTRLVTLSRVNNNSRPGRRCSDKITGKAVGNRYTPIRERERERQWGRERGGELGGRVSRKTRWASARKRGEREEREIERGGESQACARRRTYASLTDHLVLISTLSWGWPYQLWPGAPTGRAAGLQSTLSLWRIIVHSRPVAHLAAGQRGRKRERERKRGEPSAADLPLFPPSPLASSSFVLPLLLFSTVRNFRLFLSPCSSTPVPSVETRRTVNNALLPRSRQARAHRFPH